MNALTLAFLIYSEYPHGIPGVSFVRGTLVENSLLKPFINFKQHSYQEDLTSGFSWWEPPFRWMSGRGSLHLTAAPGDLVEDLRELFVGMRNDIGPPQLVIGFDCVLRGLEMERRQVRHVASRIMADNNVVGFATYGEQYQAMHLNQTFTGVAIGRAPVQ